MQVKNCIHVISVARILVRALICLSTSEAIWARNCICVVSVTNASAEVQTSSGTECTRVGNCLSVWSVKKLLVGNLILLATRELILVKDPTNVISVRKLTDTSQPSLFIKEYILGRNLIDYYV